MIGHAIFIMAFAVSMACMTYRDFAYRMNWPVGTLFRAETPLPFIVAGITALFAIGKSFFIFYWWSPFVVLFSGYVLAYITTMIFKKNTQILAIIGVFPMAALTILYHSEAKPFGILHLVFR